MARAGELSGDGLYAVSAGGSDLVLVRAMGKLRAFEGRCPHQGALLGEGELDRDVLVCRNHGWRFSIDTGARQGGREQLLACPVVERDGQILVDVSPLDSRRRPAAPAHCSVRDLGGPRGLPLLGNILQFRPSTLHQVIERWTAEYGPVYVFRIGRRPVIVVSDPGLAVQVLRARPETYRRLSSIEPAFRGMGIAGVFSAEGSAWRPQRRLAVEALSSRHLPGFYPTLRTVAARLLRRLEAAADSRQRVDIVEELKRFTVDVTTALAFGHDVNTIEQPGHDVIQRRLELVFPVLNRRILFDDVPLSRFVRLPGDRRLDRAMADLRAWLGDLVAQARARLAAEPGRPPGNFLEAMLIARDDIGQPFSDQMIFGNLMNMLLAGEDTTAYTLAWAVHLLCESPPQLQSLRTELDRALGSARVPPGIEVTNRLRYAAAVASEAMRLHPVAPFLGVEAITNTVLGDLQLPAGTRVYLTTRPPVLDPARFRQPGSFCPERWLDGVGEGPHDPSAHVPFGSGPRVCPGRSLALLEMKVVVATLYKNFEVIRDGEPGAVQEAFSFTMFPRGLRVRLRPR